MHRLIAYLFITSSIIYVSCNSGKKEQGKPEVKLDESLLSRDKRFTEDYIKYGTVLKGDSAFFVDRNAVPVIFSKGEFLPFEKGAIQNGDNVSFFDKEGNIWYQALVKDTLGEKKLLCQSLTTGDYYLLSPDSLTTNIEGLGTRISEIKVFKQH